MSTPPLISPALPPASIAPAPDSPLRAVTGRADYDYLVSEPPGATSGRPLLLFLHGTTPRGTNVWDVAQQGPPRLLAGGPDLTTAERAVAAELQRQFVVVAPQCPPFEVWNDAALLRLLDELARADGIDPARVYLTGLSMGGFGAWSLAMRHPGRFAAVVPICGGGRVADVAVAAREQPAALARLGVWAFHGARDYVVPVEESQRMIDALQLAGVRDVRLTVYPDAEHDAWTATYANPEIYAWLRAHARS